MSGAIATGIAVSVAGAAAGALISKALAPKPQKPADPAQLAAPAQQTKAPDVNAYKTKNANAALAGPNAGAASTLLTGASGIDTDSLNLGKNTLLGG